jgi:hypothetical protein
VYFDEICFDWWSPQMQPYYNGYRETGPVFASRESVPTVLISLDFPHQEPQVNRSFSRGQDSDKQLRKK